MANKFNWNKPTQYDDWSKKNFHNMARARLRKLANALGLEPGTYDIRGNKGGIAVSGEITLHGEHCYIQVNQSISGPGQSILYRRCNGRKDYTGEHNHFAALSMLDNIEGLAGRIEGDLGPCYKPNANEVQNQD